jgi:GMP synthase-like glutamine amidotransferase
VIPFDAAGVVVLQNQDSAPPGLLAAWADGREIALDVVRVDRPVELPDPARYAFAVALGSNTSLAGPRPGWVVRQLDWLRDADRAGLPVLGICFGAQALAVAHGGRVTRLAVPEMGWIELETAAPAIVPGGPWLTFHDDTIGLPAAAVELARTAVGPQAFTVGRHLGLQFHPEVTPAILDAWLGDEPRLTRAGVTREGLAGEAREQASAAAAAAHRLFDGFAARAGVRFGRPTLRRAARRPARAAVSRVPSHRAG